MIPTPCLHALLSCPPNHLHPSSALCIPRLLSPLSLPLQVWLQEFAWTEAEVARKRSERASSLPPESYEGFCLDCEPMFCMEVSSGSDGLKHTVQVQGAVPQGSTAQCGALVVAAQRSAAQRSRQRLPAWFASPRSLCSALPASTALPPCPATLLRRPPSRCCTGLCWCMTTASSAPPPSPPTPPCCFTTWSTLRCSGRRAWTPRQSWGGTATRWVVAQEGGVGGRGRKLRAAWGCLPLPLQHCLYKHPDACC